MCGIAGLCTIGGGAASSTLTLHAMTQLIRHRGPDDEGYVAVSTRDGAATPLGGADSQLPLPDILCFDGCADLFFAHRRLSIIDLSPAGHQPMNSNDGALWITYNGELYNYNDLRAELEKRGHVFRTRTDTEVLLTAYDEWGEKCLDHFDGMWAFVLYDKQRNLLFGSRDRFGVKPLYYVKNNDYFAFASEAKAFAALPGFRRTARSEAIFDYLAFGIERWEDGATFLSEVMELPPAHAFRFDLAGKSLRVRRYYELPYRDEAVWEPFCEKRAAEYVEQVRGLIFASVRRRLSSDVPVGSCLSGGIDSSSIFGAIGAILKNERIAEVGESPRAFTACYDDASVDESAWARLAAEHTGGEWHTVFPRSEELLADLEDLIYTQDFPFGGTSIYAQYRVLKLAKERGVTVLLDGQGGDELFTGYAPYYTAFFREMLLRGAWRDLAREWRGLENAPLSQGAAFKRVIQDVLIRTLPTPFQKAGIGRRNATMSYLAPDFVKRHYDQRLEAFIEKLRKERDLNSMLHSLMTSRGLPELLRYEDRNSMRFQIESRTPFADDRHLIETVFSVPSVYKIHNGFSKWLLRESMKPVLPEAIYRRRDKIGFATPEQAWFRGHRDYFGGLLNEKLSAFCDTAKIQRDRDALASNTTSWKLLNLALWMKQ